jgi:5-methylcytosine-specific restriction endonuclease McrA
MTMTWQKRGARKGKRRLPESQRQRIIKRDRTGSGQCWLNYSDRCIGIFTNQVEVHHVVDAEDGGLDEDYNLETVCKPCHAHHSAIVSQQRAAKVAWDWQRKPERHPGVLDDDAV